MKELIQESNYNELNLKSHIHEINMNTYVEFIRTRMSKINSTFVWQYLRLKSTKIN